MERFLGYLLLVQALVAARASPPVEERVRANNQSAGDLPSCLRLKECDVRECFERCNERLGYPSTRCSAGVKHTTPPGHVPQISEELHNPEPRPAEDDTEPQEAAEEADNADAEPVETDPPLEVTTRPTTTTTERTTAKYRAPEKLTNPAFYIDDE